MDFSKKKKNGFEPMWSRMVSSSCF